VAFDALAAHLTQIAWDGDPLQTSAAARRTLVVASTLRGMVNAPSADLVGAALFALAPAALATELLPSSGELLASGIDLLTRAEHAGVDPTGLYERLLNVQLTRDRTGTWTSEASQERRRAGAHFTPLAIAEFVVSRCLGPLLEDRTSRSLLELDICDPSMGAGVFLVATARLLAERLRCLLEREGRRVVTIEEARRSVIEHCLCGVDNDPNALALTRLVLWREAGADPRDLLPLRLASLDTLKDPIANRFSEVFERIDPGFDAIVGNPPWVAYVGRATQPLREETRRYYTEHYSSFRRYRTLHGLFIERSTQLLRPGGRLGLVLPTSMADLAGYAPAREAHDALCVADQALPDLGDGQFDEVFQPCMVLLSTRRQGDDKRSRKWCLERNDLTEHAARLLTRMSELPRCPADLFGERGYQTTGPDRATLVRSETPPSRDWIALRSGTEVGEFRRRPVTTFAKPNRLSQRVRPPEEWRRVRLLIRQTARYPIAAASDGLAFRNSILAGFETAEWPWALTLAYLNSTVVRWFHFHSHRDARQGMPQLKISHLRALPRPPDSTTLLGRELQALGERLAERNDGLLAAERSALDELVGNAFSLSSAERELVARWGALTPPPRPRSRD
jgi:hypothetical protein